MSGRGQGLFGGVVFRISQAPKATIDPCLGLGQWDGGTLLGPPNAGAPVATPSHHSGPESGHMVTVQVSTKVARNEKKEVYARNGVEIIAFPPDAEWCLAIYIRYLIFFSFSLFTFLDSWMGAGLACSHFRLPTLRGQPSRFFPSLSINSRSLEMLTDLSTTKTRLTLCLLVGLQSASLALGKIEMLNVFLPDRSCPTQVSHAPFPELGP
ncbi:hypothetical protein F5144DRAFT_211951 [Chaetomium tenue]|uniref:Uncharacterized protein n=1 Tax=Chaetomium tenue TaxID=1854479 RepID=A0ACB7PGB4_9PEZI|nr:hypothetical protein F5144DRAFT_211951 [Chaetomium globosum]